MDEMIRKRLEYEEQFFGISSLIFSDCFKKFVKDEVELNLKALKENMSKKLCDEVKNPDQFEISIQKLTRDLSRAYMNIWDRLFPEIDGKISTFVQIPSNVLLKEDLFAKCGTRSDINEIQHHIKILENTFASMLYLREKLKEELEEVQTVENCFLLCKFME